ncbi:MAG: VCBS repeat-containing protein, partial [Bacteroidales bacterium]|nr:VCBS repeat-containing protein [Bacteroidales bacterium]MBN2818698.1 VCBS repeat-containing protein [Bacteroidales bacterium]
MFTIPHKIQSKCFLALLIQSILLAALTGQEYCIPNPTNGTIYGDFIDGVSLEEIYNWNTGGQGDTNYTRYYSKANLIEGHSYSLLIRAGNYSLDTYSAWIDFNQNGIFESTEFLGSFRTSVANQESTINFTVPSDIPVGSTRLRVRCTYTTSPTPCDYHSYGETEDYNIEIKAAAPYPYSTNFNVLDKYWDLDNGLNEIEHSTASNEENMVLSFTKTTVNVINIFGEADLLIDLSSSINPELVFKYRELKNYYPLNNKLYFSDDGGDSFTEIGIFYSSDGKWQINSVDIKKYALENGLSLNSEFVIRFETATKMADSKLSAIEFDDISVKEGAELWKFQEQATNSSLYKEHYSIYNSGDFDNDGDRDSIISDVLNRNDEGTYTPLSDCGLVNLSDINSLFIDIDNDQQKEIIINGWAEANKYTKIYKYIGNDKFEEVPYALPGSIQKFIAGDLNNDGLSDLVLLHTKTYLTGNIGEILLNNGDNSFSKQPYNLIHKNTGTYRPVLIDFDNDGDLDYFIPPSTIYRNDIDSLVHIFTDINFSSASFYDYDGDGDIDIVNPTNVYINQGTYNNSSPSTPSAVSSKINGQFVNLRWKKSIDTESTHLMYNIRIGTTSGSNDVFESFSTISGDFLLNQSSNVGFNNNWYLKLPAGDYYWSVQAIDQQYNSSAFTTSQAFTIEENFTKFFNYYMDDQATVAVGDIDNNSMIDIIYTDGYIEEPFPDENYAKSILNYTPDSIVVHETGLNLFAGGFVHLYNYLNNISYGFTGYTYTESSGILTISDIYNNPLLGLREGLGVFGDLNNDGSCDQLFSLKYPYSNIYNTEIYLNENGIYNLYNHNLPDIFQGFSTYSDHVNTFTTSIAIIDYDNDLDNDIFISGVDESLNYYSHIYENNNMQFTKKEFGFIPMFKTSVDWADYDNDGDLDLLISGEDEGGNQLTSLYKNNITSFHYIDLQLNHMGAVGWGDFNADGLMDFFSEDYVYFNVGNDIFVQSEDMVSNPVKCVDFNKDGRLDLLTLNGVYINNWGNINTPPSAPQNLTHYSPDSNNITLIWDKANDAENSAGLTYNIFIGTSPDIADIVSPASDLTSGFRKIISIGNTGCDTSWNLKGLELGKYYWKVQAIDHSFEGGSWSVIDSFYVTEVSTNFSFNDVCFGSPTTFTDLSVTTDTIIAWKWLFDDGTASTEQNPTHLFQTADAFDVTLWAYSESGDSSSRTQKVIVYPAPDASFSVDPVCIGDVSYFTNHSDTSTITVNSWLWDFGNSKTSDVKDDEIQTYTASDTATLTIYATNGCWDTDTQSVIVAEIPKISIGLAAGYSNSFCKNDSTVLLVEGNENFDFQWTLNGVDITGETDTFLIVKSVNGNYGIVVTNSLANCTDEDNISILIDENPDQPSISLEPGYASYLCDGEDALLSTNMLPGHKYEWFRGESFEARNIEQIFVNKAGKYALKVTDSLTGCSNTISDTFEIAVTEAPEVPSINPWQDQEFCFGEHVLLSVEEVALLKYRWYKNGELLPNDTLSNLMVTQTGNYSLIVINPFGCMKFSKDTVDVQVNALPPKPSILITGETEFCSDINETQLSSSGTAEVFHWIFNES